MTERDPERAKKARSTKAEDVIAECAERMRVSHDHEYHNRLEAIRDLEFLRGEHWPEELRKMRHGRPCLTVNTLPTFLAQVTNDLRRNKISIKVHPVDGNADPETAKAFQGIIKHIEFDSNADLCQHMAVEHAASCGEGYFRLLTEYEHPNSFYQCIKFAPIVNPLSVCSDPYSVQPDGSDKQWWALPDDLSRDEFERTYPDADPCSFEAVGLMAESLRDWAQEDTVRVVEYYRYEDEKNTLHLLADGTTKWEFELVETDQSIDTRKSTRRKVVWYKLSATEILDGPTEIPCEWIPVFPVYGAEIRVSGKTYRSSLIRNARDAAQMYNVFISSATEEIALRPKIPYIMAEGQDEGYEDMWARANTSNAARLVYKPVTVDGVAVPPPQRQPMTDVPAGVLTMAGHFRDDQKAAMGLFDSSMGASGTASSGKQEEAQQRQGQITNAHYGDNLARAVRHAGRCALSMIPRIYDTPRVVRILGDDDTMSHVEVNGQKMDPKTGAMKSVNDLSSGRYDLTTSSGPAYQTMRQEAAESMRDMVQAFPQLMAVAGDKIIKASNWPDGDIIAERVKRQIPPEITQGEDGDKDQQQSPELMQMQQQMQQMQQQYEQALSDAMQQIKSGQQQQQTEVEKARASAGATVEIAKIKAMADIEAKVAVAEIEAANRPPEPEAVEPGEQQPDATAQGLAMVADAMAALAAPRRKLMRIQAPSGGVYEGEVIEMQEGQPS